MTYKTTRAIRDLQDDEYCYYEGAVYPRKGLEVSEERISELLEKGFIASADAQADEEAEQELTAKEIKAKLDEMGIVYNSRAKKEELKALLEEAQGE